ncbi:threonylcarbamoyl-AMP synthase [Phymastichus coffea]|uniref:threonylcarbamoyl-AMP synthase n=1 Tax=Phymastichus coffea TaxID=108790 RepID=UPI00273A83E7|nr:threonylcarbamoyl-AMP synthase [Phymastichus coffea]XP_058810404.1 threonylcarbamoyl-AMP synthase [Phymastichus coffea]
MRLSISLLHKLINPYTMGPIKQRLNHAKQTIKDLPGINQWMCGGFRSAAIAAELLRNGKIIAIPTDTIYGLAGLAQNDDAISKLYDIKKRDASKPVAICLWNVKCIPDWANTEDLPTGLVDALLPGPFTLVLKRKETLNKSLNPGVENVGIRVPNSPFILSVVKMLDQPIALTSANESNQRSTLHPSEFENLWPELDGVFYEHVGLGIQKQSWRNGSTVIDLSIKGKYTILRKGIGYQKAINHLNKYKLQQIIKKKCKEKSKESNEEECKISETAQC